MHLGDLEKCFKNENLDAKIGVDTAENKLVGVVLAPPEEPKAAIVLEHEVCNLGAANFWIGHPRP